MVLQLSPANLNANNPRLAAMLCRSDGTMAYYETPDDTPTAAERGTKIVEGLDAVANGDTLFTFGRAEWNADIDFTHNDCRLYFDAMELRPTHQFTQFFKVSGHRNLIRGGVFDGNYGTVANGEFTFHIFEVTGDDNRIINVTTQNAPHSSAVQGGNLVLTGDNNTAVGCYSANSNYGCYKVDGDKCQLISCDARIDRAHTYGGAENVLRHRFISSSVGNDYSLLIDGGEWISTLNCTNLISSSNGTEYLNQLIWKNTRLVAPNFDGIETVTMFKIADVEYVLMEGLDFSHGTNSVDNTSAFSLSIEGHVVEVPDANNMWGGRYVIRNCRFDGPIRVLEYAEEVTIEDSWINAVNDCKYVIHNAHRIIKHLTIRNTRLDNLRDRTSATLDAVAIMSTATEENVDEQLVTLDNVTLIFNVNTGGECVVMSRKPDRPEHWCIRRLFQINEGTSTVFAHMEPADSLNDEAARLMSAWDGGPRTMMIYDDSETIKLATTSFDAEITNAALGDIIWNKNFHGGDNPTIRGWEWDPTPGTWVSFGH